LSLTLALPAAATSTAAHAGNLLDNPRICTEVHRVRLACFRLHGVVIGSHFSHLAHESPAASHPHTAAKSASAIAALAIATAPTIILLRRRRRIAVLCKG